MLTEMFNEAGWFAKLTLLMGVTPLFVAIAYAARPTERRLSLVRVMSLSAIFGAVSGVTAGFIAVLHGIGVVQNPAMGRAYVGMSEALFPAFLNFGFLAVAWLLVAVGMMRRPE